VFRKLTLKNKILILVTIVTVLMMSVIVIFDSYILQKSVEETYVGQLEGITTAINGRYEESHSVEDVQQIFDYIQYKKENVLQLTLYGNNEILASTDRSRIGSPTPADLLDALKLEQTLITHIHNNEDGIHMVLLKAPLKEDGDTVGAIELLLNTTNETILIEDRIKLIVLVALGITVLLLVALWLIIRKLLILPLLKIRKAAISVKQGLEYEEIEIKASQEINEVATAFNDMVQNLEGRYKELQQALTTIKKTQKQLVESEKMVALGNLVAGVSHEINTPIGIGVTATSYLEEKTKDLLELYQQGKMKKSNLEDYLHTVNETMDMIQTNLVRASELVKSFKQVAVDQSIEIKRTFKIKEYIDHVLLSLKPNLKKTQHKIAVYCSEDIEIYSYPGAFSQIITNFVMNSLIHAYEDEDQGIISIQITKSDHGITIEYTDDGKGMSEYVVNQIFNPFFTTNRGGGGTGLGMHIVYNLVTQSLGGNLACESKLGVGTTFIIDIPIKIGGINIE
jgi:two-component system NtrC family sensor kinase